MGTDSIARRQLAQNTHRNWSSRVLYNYSSLVVDLFCCFVQQQSTYRAKERNDSR